MTPLNTNLSVLIGMAERVLDGRKAMGFQSVDLGERDRYHIIPDEQLFDVDNIPEGPFPIRSMSDDLAAFGKLLSEHDRPVTSVDVARLAHVHRVLAAVM